MIWTEEKEAQIKQYKSIVNRGRLVSSRAVTDLFNEVFNANAKPVSCATCIRNRILKMYKEYEKYLKEKAEQEATQALETHVPDVQADEVVEEPITPKKRAGRPKKKKETEE